MKVGIAKYITKVNQKKDNRFNKIFLNFLSGKMNYGFIDMSIDHLDFIGVNYYGKEVIEDLSRLSILLLNTLNLAAL